MNFPRDLYYDPSFVHEKARAEIFTWLSTIYPLWEQRYSPNHPPPPGESHRPLLRPVYWLGNWQFACLGYYRPPKGLWDRCVRAEPFPPVLAKMVVKMETVARRLYRGPDMPVGWKLNTCLVNLYGNQLQDGKKVDTARVGEHKDFEPGPVASVSLGERAMFQFVKSRRPGSRDAVAFQQWLDDGSLQIFGGRRWKEDLFHRVQRVDRKLKHSFPLNVDHFDTRRINFTFRYVPEKHIQRFSQLSNAAASDIRGYLETLAAKSSFFRREIEEKNRSNENSRI